MKETLVKSKLIYPELGKVSYKIGRQNFAKNKVLYMVTDLYYKIHYFLLKVARIHFLTIFKRSVRKIKIKLKGL